MTFATFWIALVFNRVLDGSPEKGWFVCLAVNGEIKRRFVEFRPNETRSA